MSFFAQKVSDGYGGYTYNPTVAGYAALVIILILLLILIGMIKGKSGNEKKISTKQITFSALAIALAMVTSYLKILDMPMGGSVTLFSMLFICLIGYWYGLGAGLMAGVAYGLLQLIVDPYIVSLPQMFCDYIFAFGALGLSGIGRNKKHGLLIGYLLGVFGRFVFAVISGVIFFAAYAPETMSPLTYSAAYNGAYLAAEAVITLILISIPPVKKALDYVRKMAIEE